MTKITPLQMVADLMLGWEWIKHSLFSYVKSLIPYYLLSIHYINSPFQFVDALLPTSL